MAEPTGGSALEVMRRQVESLRHELSEKSRQLSELDVMPADDHAERARPICDLRRLQAQLCEAEEQLQANSKHD